LHSLDSIMVGGTNSTFLSTVSERNVEKALALIKNGSNVNECQFLRSTALHIAAGELDLEMVRMLLENGAKTDATEMTNNYTPLHNASHSNNYSEIIAGMTYLFVNKKLSKLPTKEELRRDQLQIIDLLIKHNAKLEEPASGGRTPLHIAVTGHIDVVNHLIAKGANKEALTTENETPLHIAAINGKRDIVKSLISNSVNIDAVDSEGHTAVHLAIINGHPETVTALLQHGATANAALELAQTYLNEATRVQNAFLFNTTPKFRLPYLGDINERWAPSIRVFEEIIKILETHLKNHPVPQKPILLTPPSAEKVQVQNPVVQVQNPVVQVQPPPNKTIVSYQVNWKPYCLLTGLGVAGIGLFLGLGASTLLLSLPLAIGVMGGLVKARNAYLNKASSYYSNVSMICAVTDKGEQEALKIGIQAHTPTGFLWSFTQLNALRHPIAATAGMKARLENKSDLTNEISKLPGIRAN
jgi:ankyrin repeat protein